MNIQIIPTIIIIGTIILYVCSKIPIPLVSLLSVTVMSAVGVLDFETAFEGFSGSTLMIIIGMMVIGNALFENGVVGGMAQKLFSRYADNEKALQTAVILISGVLSGFLNNAAVMVAMMPTVSYYISKSKGKFNLLTFYLPLAQAVIIGSRISLAGSAAQMLAQDTLLSSGQRGFSFFETGFIGLPSLLTLAAVYYFFLYDFGKKLFRGRESAQPYEYTEENGIKYEHWKYVLSAFVAIASIGAFVFINQIKKIFPGVNNAAIAMLGASVLLITGCLDFKKTLQKMDWGTVIIIGAAAGFAECFQVSGLGDAFYRIVERIGFQANSALLLVTVFTVASTVFANLMSNAASIPLLCSFAISLGTSAGCNPVALVMAVVCGSANASTLPTATSSVSMSLAAGYKYTDYMVMGTIVSVVCNAVNIISIMLVYNLW